MPNRSACARLTTWLHRRLKHKKGWIAAIEPESAEYVLARTLVDAAIAGRRRFARRPLHFIRIGYDYVHRQVGGFKKLS